MDFFWGGYSEAYEEDFILKEKNVLNKKIKSHNINEKIYANSQLNISKRIAIFGNKKAWEWKYFLVNLFCSENNRNQPEEIESDF